MDSLKDNWRGKTSPSERRRIQNRLNQRAWRERQKTGDSSGSIPRAGVHSQEPHQAPSLALTTSALQLSDDPPPASTLEDAEAIWPHQNSHALVTVPAPYSRLPRLHSKYMTLTAYTRLNRYHPIVSTKLSDADELQDLFVRQAREHRNHRNHRYSTPDPMADQLLALIQLNTFRAVLANMSFLGIGCDVVCDDEAISPFNIMDDAAEGALTSVAAAAMPPPLRPTALQLSTRHHPWLDVFPAAGMRDNLVRAGRDWDDDPLCVDMLGLGDASLGRPGFVVWGEPWDPAGWEVTHEFALKWGWVIHGCAELLASTNYWRARRDERPVYF